MPEIAAAAAALETVASEGEAWGQLSVLQWLVGFPVNYFYIICFSRTSFFFR